MFLSLLKTFNYFPTFLVILAMCLLKKQKKFRQRLVATAEGPFSTVRLIMRPARRQEANRVHTLV